MSILKRRGFTGKFNPFFMLVNYPKFIENLFEQNFQLDNFKLYAILSTLIENLNHEYNLHINDRY
ncbi:hypothetical protein AAKU52_002785 [Pedobacter sp. CG_S7]